MEFISYSFRKLQLAWLRFGATPVFRSQRNKFMFMLYTLYSIYRLYTGTFVVVYIVNEVIFIIIHLSHFEISGPGTF